MPISCEEKSALAYSRARKARDARFDGVFFTAVKTTGIYCRPVCPAKPPLERNVEYHTTAVSAAMAGYRPCLRCRPESAPSSPAWQGAKTSLQRAVKLIDAGALQDGSLEDLASRLGISSRYLRDLFKRELGVSPKRYATYQQCMFAKQLLHTTNLAIAEIAFSSGFNSVRRFNEAMQQHLGLSPSQIRKSASSLTTGLVFLLHYRPPFVWSHMLNFLSKRVISGLEWSGDNCYGRTIRHGDGVGYFEVSNEPDHSRLRLKLVFDRPESYLRLHYRLRHLFDVDADILSIDSHLQSELASGVESEAKASLDYLPGLRIPGIWSTFEAGVRAILGQQVSVGAAQKLVQTFVDELGEDLPSKASAKLFPRPEVVLKSSLDFFRMPQARKDTLHRFAQHFIDSPALAYIDSPKPDDIDKWLELKGIGPWTVNYVKLRGTKDPDVWLAGDAGVKNAIKKVGSIENLERFSPWRSYLTFQLWNQL